jgi:sugar lactone lactonase YvrE
MLHQWGGGGIVPGSFEEPVGIDVDGEGNIYVADTWNQRVQVFDGDGEYLREWPVEAWYGESVGFDANSFSLPTGIDVDEEGKIYVSDTDGQRVLQFEPLP